MKLSIALQALVQRSILNSLPRRYKGPHVSFAGTYKEVAIHLSQPTEHEFFAALERAELEGFDLVCVYL